MPDHEAVISGWSRHLRALLLEGLPPPPSTSMMRNRGVADLGAHLVDPSALEPPSLQRTIDRAMALAEQDGMRHLLVVSSEGMVVVSGAPPFEAMAHWHNIEFAARVECLRLEEAATSAEGGLTWHRSGSCWSRPATSSAKARPGMRRRESLLWTDIAGRRIHRLDPASGEVWTRALRRWPVPCCRARPAAWSSACRTVSI